MIFQRTLRPGDSLKNGGISQMNQKAATRGGSNRHPHRSVNYHRNRV